MSCSVKSSCGKNWCGSQRKIGSLPEEATQQQQQQQQQGATTSIAITTTSTTTMTTVTTMTTPIVGNVVSAGQRIATPRPVKSIATKKGEDSGKLLKYIDDNLIGKSGTFFGPFGRRKVVFCDYTATGRSLQFFEDYIVKEVLPSLGDTRISTSICNMQSSLFRNEAKEIVRHGVGANEQDAVLFTGQCTADALRTLLRHLDLSKATVVFVGPFEHHSNLRPWREYERVKVVRVSETREGFLDLNELERGLAKARSEGAAQMIGCFSAASCITGVLSDDVATTLLLHQYGALSVWDYTTAAPYAQIDANPHLPGVGETAAHKDAIIFATHKFVGGAQGPGVLLAKRHLLGKEIETGNTRDSHRYLRNPELREESDTAGVVESVRCGLAFQLKDNVSQRVIVARQDKISRQVLAHVRTIPELTLLGSSSQSVKRLPIFSFMVRHPRGTFLHHNFVCAILNDVFGIQARGGCACAGQYAHDLMGIDGELAKEYENVLVESQRNSSSNAEPLRPGFAKLSFPYFMSDAEVAFVLEALKMVATEGWKLLQQYIMNPETGEWRHHTNGILKELKWLGAIRYTDGRMNASERRVSGPGAFPQNYADCLQIARNIFNRARKMAQRYPLRIDRFFDFVTEKTESLRWFMLPTEAQDLLLGYSQNVKQEVPFCPTALPWNRYGHAIASHDNSTNGVSLTNNGIRRLNSDIPRSGNAPISSNSPRHQSLPVLNHVRRGTISSTNELGASSSPSLSLSPSPSPSPSHSASPSPSPSHSASPCPSPSLSQSPSPSSSPLSSPSPSPLSLPTTVPSTKTATPIKTATPTCKPMINENSNALAKEDLSRDDKSPATCPSSPMPIRFAVGEAVTLSAICRISQAGVARSSSKEHGRESMDTRDGGRARCNSLGSTTGTSGNSGNATSSYSSIVPALPLSPQTLTSLGLGASNAASTKKRLHCSCSSQTELNSLEFDSAASSSHSVSSLTCHNVASPPSSFSSVGEYAERIGTCGRSSSPTIFNLSQRSEDDLSAYVKEVTKELATEIKSEIREVISKVDDALSESNTSENTPQHHSRNYGVNSLNHASLNDDKQTRHDSFTASDIAEYLMEFSKEMASEVKSEIRCMVNAVDGLHRHSPDASASASISDASSNGCGSPDRGRLGFSSMSPRLSSTIRKHAPTEMPGKIGELTQQESKMSSECSSDETVIYVMKPTDNEPIVNDLTKTNDENEIDVDVDDDAHDHDGLEIGDARKILPKIYSAVNSVSSQDSGINLSFHESDKSINSVELKRSSSADSNSINGYGRKPRTTLTSTSTSTSLLSDKGSLKDCLRRYDDLSEDEERPDDERNKMLNESLLKRAEDKADRKNVLPYALWQCSPKNVWMPMIDATQEFDMIRDNDRVLVCLSVNGKDSLSLLHTLQQYKFYTNGINFEIGAATIVNEDRDVSEMAKYLEALCVPYFHEVRADIDGTSPASKKADGESTPSGFCTFCERNVRGQLYEIAKRHNYNVLAVGQHLDDLTEGFLLSILHEGQPRTMKGHYRIRQRDLRVIRPYVYVTEKAIRQFADSKIFLSSRKSRAIDHSERYKRGKELTEQERVYPRLYWSVRTAFRPAVSAHDDTTSVDLTYSGSWNSPTKTIGGSNKDSGSDSGDNVDSSASKPNAIDSGSDNVNRQKRYRKAKTNTLSASSVQTVYLAPRQLDNDEETDEEPVL